MKPSPPIHTTAKHSTQRVPSPKAISGSVLPWLILVIAAIVCGVALWRMRTISTTPQPSEVTPPAAPQSNEVQSLIDGLVPIPERNFLMGKTEVTQAQWEAVMGADTNCTANPDHPVSDVSWNDCQAFLVRLNELPAVKDSGLTFRLPTEEEWVFACRAGAKGRFGRIANGTEITEDTLDRFAWFKDNSDEKVHPVRQKEPNAFGLHDMNGNVSEWCQNELGDMESWAKGETCEHNRVYHGGSANLHFRFCEFSYRDWAPPSTRKEFLGFRLCADKR